MAKDGDIRIDLRGDGRVILYKRDNLKDPVWQVRVRVPNSTGYKRISTKTSDQREAERFALNYYEELYIHVKTGGSIKSKTFKQVFAEWEKHVATMGQNDRPSNIGACNTASWPPNINPTDEANAPLIYATISAKCSDDGQS